MPAHRSIAKAAADGAGYLEAIAAELARTLQDPDTPASAKAALSKELRQVMAQVGSAAEGDGGDSIDDLAAKRDARRATAPSGASAPRRSQPRRSNGSHRTGGVARDGS